MKTQIYTDTECYPGYWLLMFMDERRRSKAFEVYDGHPLDVEGVRRYLEHPGFEFVTFNGLSYDEPMIAFALEGADPAQLKELSDQLIKSKERNERSWEVVKRYGLQPLGWDHVDLIEVAPGMVSLKIYGGRMHRKKLQDLPLGLDTFITPDLRPVLRLYCKNDLDTTMGLAQTLKPDIDLRREMSAEIGVDLRSKSDAQISEAVIKQAVFHEKGWVPKKKPITYTSFHYKAPAFVRFATPELRHVLEVLQSATMVVKATGHVQMPKEIDDLEVVIGGQKYTVGLGGLHSNEKAVMWAADAHHVILDTDVTSYYPRLILNSGMYPEAIGQTFTIIYQGIVDQRVEAKHKGHKRKADTLKITVNGAFGKTSNKYSILFNPKMMIHTTLTGQLSLLMFIEALVRRGFQVISANTDGVVARVPKNHLAEFNKVVRLWERVTNLETEETEYTHLYSRDVNNYIAVKPSGAIKTKGIFAPQGLAKSPQNEICTDAVIAHLTKGVPVEDTISNCTDIRKFLTLRTVKGGAVKEGYTLGKAVRWYYATGMEGTINYAETGNIVARSEGAKPCMDLPDEFPTDVNLDWYINECKELLMDVGAVKRPPPVKLPRKNSKAYKALVEQGVMPG